jgi:hypothetical protein
VLNNIGIVKPTLLLKDQKPGQYSLIYPMISNCSMIQTADNVWLDS